MSKRVFVGLPVSLGVVKLTEEWQNQHKGLPVRWQKLGNLHITLVPPWETEDVQRATEQLKKIRAGKIRLEFKKIEFGPKKGEPKQIWATGPATKELLDFRVSVFGCLSQTSGDRPFVLHATLARFKAGTSLERLGLAFPEAINWQMNAEKFVLYESILKPEGSDYKILGELALE